MERWGAGDRDSERTVVLLSLLAMAAEKVADLALKDLSKGSAKIASFKVRILHGRTVIWEYDSKYTGEKKGVQV